METGKAGRTAAGHGEVPSIGRPAFGDAAWPRASSNPPCTPAFVYAVNRATAIGAARWLNKKRVLGEYLRTVL